jgi:hypothetical protein
MSDSVPHTKAVHHWHTPPSHLVLHTNAGHRAGGADSPSSRSPRRCVRTLVCDSLPHTKAVPHWHTPPSHLVLHTTAVRR